MRLLVTGASGFVGIGLREALAVAGIGFTASSREPREGFVATGPIGLRTDWRPALEGCTAVVHLAAVVHRRGSAAEYRTVNIEGTLKLAREAAQAGVSRFVFVSTAKLHGERNLPGQAFVEARHPAPKDAYARSKWTAEQGLAQLSRTLGLPVVVIRPPLVHGPGVGGNLYRLMRLIDRGWPLPLGAVDNRRSLLGRDNLASLILACLIHPSAVGETFLAADGQDVSTTQLLQTLARLLDRPARLLPVPAPLLDRTLRALGRAGLADRLLGNFQVDAGKARRLLGWTPTVPLEQGLAQMVAAYRASR